MRRVYVISLLGFIIGAGGCFLMQTTKGFGMQWFELAQGKIEHIDEIVSFIPSTIEEILLLEKNSIDHAKKRLQSFLEQESSLISKKSVLYEFDRFTHLFFVALHTVQIFEMVHPEKSMRDAAHEAFLRMYTFAIDSFNDKKIYELFKAFGANTSLLETLDAEERYGYDEIMKEFELSGLGLDDAQFLLFKELQKKQVALETAFSMNINMHQGFILCDKEQLQGMNESYIDAMERNEEGKYIVRPDYPTSAELLSFCVNEETRKSFWRLFNNRAYPQNVSVLEELIALRQRIASLLGFHNFAELDLATKMAKNPSKVRAFLKKISVAARKKCSVEMKAWIEGAPALECQKGMVAPWNIAYIKKAYERDHFAFDEREIRPYFSMEKTIQGIFNIYQDFLGLRFEVAPIKGLWHEDVQCITIYNKEECVPRGYILLDLYPRLAKYSHACQADFIHPIINEDGSIGKNLGLVIANFPKSTKTEPSLLKHSDVVTFFHEFGHAMHHVLGVTKLHRFAGTSVLRDFVELPSQMFEEWVWQPAMIKKISAHYQTGESIPDALIEKMLAKKKYDAGYVFCRQLVFADFSLTLHEMERPDFDALLSKISKRYMPEVVWDDEYHMYTAFDHLTNYAASYYGYLWSLVFACDIFNELKYEGLSALAGERFVAKILKKGGSVHPERLLKEYLGRSPSEDAFFKAYDLE